MAAQRDRVTHKERPSDAAAPCQLYAVVEVGPGALERISALLAAYPLTSLMIVGRGDQALTPATVKPLVDLGQKKNCAVLLADDAALARTLRADGVHLSPGADLDARYDEARSILGAGAIVGVDVGLSRHLAMAFGEAGADYIGFSPSETVPAPVTSAEDESDANDFGPRDQDDLVAWWSEVFEVPCVALEVGSADAARQFAALGADFVVVRCAGGDSVPDSVARLLSFAQAVEAADVG